MKKNKIKNLIITGIIIGVLLSFSNATAQEPAWTYETSGSVLSVASTEDIIVGGSRGGMVSAFDISGTLKWRYKTDGDVGSIAIFGDTLAVGSADSNIYVFDKDTGQLKWTAYAGEFPKVAVSDKFVVVGSYDNSLYVVDKDSGGVIWNKTRAEEIGSIFSIAISKNTVVAVTGDLDTDMTKGAVYAFDIETGEELWKYKVEGWVYTLAVSDDMIVAGSWEKERGAVFEKGRGGVYAFDKNGNLKWRFTAVEDITSVAISGDNVAFGVGHTYDEDMVYLVDKETGNVSWSQYIRAPNTDLKSPFSVQWIALTEGSVIVGLRDGKVHAYEKKTGCERWDYKTKSDVHTVTASNGKIVAGSLDRSFYVFDEGEIGSASWCKKQMSESTLRIIEIVGVVAIILGIAFLVLLFSGKIRQR